MDEIGSGNKTPLSFADQQKDILRSLTEFDGKPRLDRLGVTDEMYQDVELAKNWHASLLVFVEAEKVGGDVRPSQILGKIYEKIIYSSGRKISPW